MVKDHSDSEKGNPLPLHRLLFPINSKSSLYAPSHRQDSTYHGLCYTSRGALAGTRNSSMGPPHGFTMRAKKPREFVQCIITHVNKMYILMLCLLLVFIGIPFRR